MIHPAIGPLNRRCRWVARLAVYLLPRGAHAIVIMYRVDDDSIPTAITYNDENRNLVTGILRNLALRMIDREKGAVR